MTALILAYCLLLLVAPFALAVWLRSTINPAREAHVPIAPRCVEFRSCIPASLSPGPSVVRGRFHGWGTDFEELSGGNVTFSVAIVEMPDGSVMLPRADAIRFLAPETPIPQGSSL